MEKLARIFGIEIGNDRSEFSNIEFTRSRYFQCKRIAITGRRLTPAYLSLDYNPPYDVAFITLKYAHRHCAIYARTRSRACTRQGKKEKRTKKKKREVKREKKNRLIRNRGQHVTMTLILVILPTTAVTSLEALLEDRCNCARIIVSEIQLNRPNNCRFKLRNCLFIIY